MKEIVSSIYLSKDYEKILERKKKKKRNMSKYFFIFYDVAVQHD